MSAAEKRDFREYYESLAELFEMMTGEAAPSLEDAYLNCISMQRASAAAGPQ